MRKKERFERFIEYFQVHSPEPQTELNYNSPYELLVAVILSAQCTDKRVNLTTPALFQKFPTAAMLAESNIEEIFSFIKSISFPNNKAKSLLGMAKLLSTIYGGVVPEDVVELQKLPGVGRKTANVIASVIYNQPTMAVDTHVYRVSKRIGLVNNSAKNPLQVENQLMKYLPTNLVHKSHHWIILHGRYICIARKPKCDICSLTTFCRYYEKMQNNVESTN